MYLSHRVYRVLGKLWTGSTSMVWLPFPIKSIQKIINSFEWKLESNATNSLCRCSCYDDKTFNSLFFSINNWNWHCHSHILIRFISFFLSLFCWDQFHLICIYIFSKNNTFKLVQNYNLIKIRYSNFLIWTNFNFIYLNRAN